MKKFIRERARRMADALSSKKGSSFRQNFIKVIKANLFAQGISMLVAPLMTRLYTPADYGTASVFGLILGILGPLSTWKMDWSTPNAVSRSQAAATMLLGFVVLFILCLLITAILIISPHYLVLFPAAHQIEPYVFLIPLAVLGSGLQQLLNGWYIRQNDLSAVSQSKITQSLGSTAFNLSAGWAGLGAKGLIFGSLLTAWLGIGVLIKNAQHLQASLARLTGRRIAQAYCRFSREATHSALVALVNTLTLNLTPLLLANYYSTTDYGYYALMSRLAMLPSSLLASAIGQSFWSEAVRLMKENRAELRRLFLKTTLRLAGLAGGASVICLGGPFYVEPVFGSRWAGAGATLAAMTPWVFAQFVVSPLSHLVVHRKQNWQLLWEACRFFLLAAVIGHGIYNDLTINMVVLRVSLVMFSLYSALFFMNLVCLRGKN